MSGLYSVLCSRLANLSGRNAEGLPESVKDTLLGQELAVEYGNGTVYHIVVPTKGGNSKIVASLYASSNGDPYVDLRKVTNAYYKEDMIGPLTLKNLETYFKELVAKAE